MLHARRLIFALSTALAVWVLASFTGTMLDPARSAFWTSSLMWSLLTSLLLSPALLVLAHYVRRTSTPERGPRDARRDPSGTEAGRPADDFHGNGDAEDEAPRIWPEPQDPEDEGARWEDAFRDEWPWIREDVEQPD
jgi:hypothetical protein